MKNKKTILIAAIAFVVLVGLLVGLYFLVGPGKKTDAAPSTSPTGGYYFSVMVTHADGSQETFSYISEEGGKLGAFLEDQGLISSEGADPGMFHTVDGEKADWNVNQSYWAFYIEGEYAMTGIYDTDIADCTVYKLVYTIG